MNNRKYKFRAWNKNHKEFETGWCYPIDFKEDCFSTSIPDGIEVNQYTGLKDKNGKEIYEGDIIINVWGYFDVPFLVVWDLYGFRLKCLKQFYYIDKDQYMDCPTHIEMTEVIGNIYQNPELLN